jgi:hypothetical protein
VIPLHAMLQFWIDQVLVSICVACVAERSNDTVHAIRRSTRARNRHSTASRRATSSSSAGLAIASVISGTIDFFFIILFILHHNIGLRVDVVLFVVILFFLFTIISKVDILVPTAATIGLNSSDGGSPSRATKKSTANSLSVVHFEVANTTGDVGFSVSSKFVDFVVKFSSRSFTTTARRASSGAFCGTRLARFGGLDGTKR